tara:strand:+ start:174 stop:287 length:114 start_codon:yes stop_codon:yes gene_type:complete
VPYERGSKWFDYNPMAAAVNVKNTDNKPQQQSSITTD